MRTRVHISLPVRDLTASTQFYENLFGTPPTKLKADYANFRLDSPGLHLALVSSPNPEGTPSGASHFGVELFEAEDLAAWRARLEKAEIPTTIEEGVTCCYAVADKAWATDPEGNRWEFWVRQEEAETMAEEPSECCETSCCS
jgi:catechol-2,3-dioxygenase